jgi:hypothetical protein
MSIIMPMGVVLIVSVKVDVDLANILGAPLRVCAETRRRMCRSGGREGVIM